MPPNPKAPVSKTLPGVRSVTDVWTVKPRFALAVTASEAAVPPLFTGNMLSVATAPSPSPDLAPA
ncbi:hypothetical protein D3C72_2232570 [compost metagenome]